MRVTGKKTYTIWEWLTIFGATAAAVAITEFVGLSQKWEDATVYTAMLFAVVVTALRPAWGRPVFWRSLLLVFVAHVIALIVVIQALPWGRFGIPKLMLLPAGVIEGLLIAAVVWKRTTRSRPDQGGD